MINAMLNGNKPISNNDINNTNDDIENTNNDTANDEEYESIPN